jgi:hypothetical protein
LFCTGCGERRAPTAPAPEPPDPNVCSSCGTALRKDAEFCTECGTGASASSIDLTVDEAEATAAVAVAAESGKSAADRVSPAASRAILGSVSGGMGSYVGKQAAGAAPAPPPPGPSNGGADDGDGRRKLAIFAVVAALVLLIGGIAVLVATQQGGDSALHAGNSTAKGRHLRSNGAVSGVDTTDGSTSSSETTGSSSSSSTSGSKSSGSKSGSKSSGSKSSGSKSGSKSSGSKSGSKSSRSKSSGSPGTSPQNPSHPTSPPPPPGNLWVSSGSVNLDGTGPGVVQIKNTGGRTISWSASLSLAVGAGHATLSDGGGSLAPGQAQNLVISWSSGASTGYPFRESDEGHFGGTLYVNPSVGATRSVSISADNRAGDEAVYAYVSSCVAKSGKTCGTGSTITINVNRKTNGAFVGAILQSAAVTVSGDYGGTMNLNLTEAKYHANYPNSGLSQFQITTRSPVTRSSTGLTVAVTDASGATGTRSFTLS